MLLRRRRGLIVAVAAVAASVPGFEVRRSCLTVGGAAGGISVGKGRPAVVLDALVVAFASAASGFGWRSDSVAVGAGAMQRPQMETADHMLYPLKK